MKKFIMSYYNWRLHGLVEAQQDYSRYLCLYGETNTIECIGLEFMVKWQDFLLEVTKSLIPKQWIKNS